MENNVTVLDQKLDSILNSKQAIKQAIINKGQTSNEVLADYASQINNIVTLEEGTQDADATASDIALNKTAYVKGEKITGTLDTISMSQTIQEEGSIELTTPTPAPVSTLALTETDISAEGATDSDLFKLKTVMAKDTLLRENSNIVLYSTYPNITTTIGLSADILKKGSQVLDIVGTLDNDYTGTIPPADYTECLNLSNEILGKS